MGRPRVSPFFHAIVVAGAGISASSCGGVSGETESKTGEPGSGGAANAGGAQPTGGNGGSAGGDGGGTGAAGGGGDDSGGSAGARPVGTGGTASGGAKSTGGASLDPPAPSAETAAQWDCSNVFGTCQAQAKELGRHILVNECTVDTNRPRTAADCDAAEWFACQAVAWGFSFRTAIYVNCECVPKENSKDCAGPVNAFCKYTACEGQQLICGCAYPQMLR